jgi:dienelactone hydrolase
MSRLVFALIFVALPAFADDATDKLAKELRDYATAELAKVPGKDGKFSTALPDYLRDQIKEANKRDREAWNAVKTKEDWEKFRDERIKALRESLGTWPEVPKNMAIRVTKTIETPDYRIDNLLYESRPGVWVDGNLYYPATLRAAMPVILIAHSHHAPKHQGELQDMGVTWAKLGCIVLVIDQLGHGERRQHPFNSAKDYPEKFRVDRQDYYFRYNLNLQLSLVGDSLIGWQAWDLMRGLDVALARPGADKDRVILLGAVAAGGDLAAVTAALDPRFKCVVPFNFGGPQPETRFPLSEDAEERFNYAGSGSWESTRNLRDSAARGFLPWVIVASVAPRKVIHAHEFAWDQEHDPVWKRYQKVWSFYDVADGIGFAHGSGSVSGQPPEATHCTNIGAIHRKAIYPYLKKWLDIPIPETDAKERRSEAELRCWTEEAVKELKPRPLHEVLGAMADGQGDRFRKTMAAIPAKDLPSAIWDGVNKATRVPLFDMSGTANGDKSISVGNCELRRVYRKNHPALWFDSIVLKPKATDDDECFPAVACLCQDGAHVFLRERAEAIAILLNSRIAVQLTDLTGTGREQPGSGRGRTSGASTNSSTTQMLAEALVGDRLSDADEAIGFRGNAQRIDRERLVIWGESFALPNANGVSLPHDLVPVNLAEPLGSTLATYLGFSYHLAPKAILARGGLVSYRSVLDSPFVHVPHDALPINVFRAGDLPDVWAALAPKPLRLEGLVDGTNRRVTGEKLQKALQPVSNAYKKGGLVVKEEYSSDAEIAKWIIEQLKR